MVPFESCGCPAICCRPHQVGDRRGKDPVVVIARDAGLVGKSSMSAIARVLGRSGFAMVGALCGLFVADDMARSDVEIFGSTLFFVAMMLSGIAGFYLGLDVPASSRRACRGTAAKAARAELLSAAGTFLTAAAALISVAIVVLDELLPVFWMLVVEASWLAGVAMQIVAGVTLCAGRSRSMTIERSRSRAFL
jgi:hypothetical protein